MKKSVIIISICFILINLFMALSFADFENDLQYETHDLHYVYTPAISTEEEIQYEISFQFPQIIYPSNQAVEDKINQQIQQNICDEKDVFGCVHILVKDYKDAFDYFIDEDEEIPAYTFMWEYREAVSVQYNKHNIITLNYSYYEYTGGAHGSYFNQFENHSLLSGDVIALTDIFKPEFETPLNEMINRQIRIDFDIKPGEALSNEGFFNDQITYSDNFYCTDEALIFYYGIYEIAPYVMGAIEVSINYTNLQNQIRPDGPLSWVLQN